MLVALVDRAEHLVTKDELFDRVWPNTRSSRDAVPVPPHAHHCPGTAPNRERHGEHDQIRTSGDLGTESSGYTRLWRAAAPT
jgi:hypothetical protein